MYSINRQVIVVKPKKPYIEWINSLPDMEDPIKIDELNNDCTSCLIPHFDYEKEFVHFDYVFKGKPGKKRISYEEIINSLTIGPPGPSIDAQPAQAPQLKDLQGEN